MRRIRHEGGYTLMEILAVITLLGVLSGIGVYALSGVNERGREKACDTDVAALRSAQEAYYATTDPSVYGNETAMVASGVLPRLSALHDVTVGASTSAATSATNSEGAAATGAAYVIKVEDASCGTVGSVVS